MADLESFEELLEKSQEDISPESPSNSLPPTPPGYNNNTNTGIQNSNSCITATTPNVNFSSVTSDAYEELRKHNLKKSQELNDNAEQCDDLLDENENESITTALETFNATSTITTNATVQHKEDQSQTIYSSSHKRRRSISQPVSSHPTKQRLTTNEIPANDYYINTVSLSNPVFSKIDKRTDRNTELKDCFGNKLVLIVHGSLPDNVETELALPSKSSKKYYHSLYQFYDFDSDETKNKLRRKVRLEKCDNDIYVIKFDHLFIRKERTDKRETEIGKEKWYKLTDYLSNNEESVKQKGPTIFANNYNLNQPQLAIQFFPNNSTEPIKIKNMENKSIFFSNFIGEDSDDDRKSNDELGSLIITKIIPDGNSISFDNNNQSIIKLQIDLPKELADKLNSYCKWFEISLLNKNSSNIYIFTTNGGDTNVIYEKITRKPFSITLVIAKKKLTELAEDPEIIRAMHSSKQQPINTVTSVSFNYDINAIIVANGWNNFCIQFRLLSGVTTTVGEKIVSYLDAPLWRTPDFTEYIEGASSIDIVQTQTTPGDIQQNRINIDLNLECDHSRGSQVTTSISKTVEDNLHEQSTMN